MTLRLCTAFQDRRDLTFTLQRFARYWFNSSCSSHLMSSCKAVSERQTERISCQNITQPGEGGQFLWRGISLPAKKRFKTFSPLGVRHLIQKKKARALIVSELLCQAEPGRCVFRECLGQLGPHSSSANPDGTCTSACLSRSRHSLHRYCREKLGGQIVPCHIHPLLRELSLETERTALQLLS